MGSRTRFSVSGNVRHRFDAKVYEVEVVAEVAGKSVTEPISVMVRNIQRGGEAHFSAEIYATSGDLEKRSWYMADMELGDGAQEDVRRERKEEIYWKFIEVAKEAALSMAKAEKW